MDERVTLTRAGRTTEYVLEEERPDGRLVLTPDLSVDAVLDRAGHRRLTADEFEHEIGQFVLPFDGEQ